METVAISSRCSRGKGAAGKRGWSRRVGVHGDASCLLTGRTRGPALKTAGVKGLIDPGRTHGGTSGKRGPKNSIGSCFRTEESTLHELQHVSRDSD